MKYRFLLALLTSSLPLALAPISAVHAQESTTYVVKSGETLNGIANRAGVSASAIVQANGLKEPYVVKVGQKLKIPRVTAASSNASPTTTRAPATQTPEGAARSAERTAARVEAASSGSSLATATRHTVQPGETLAGIANRAKVPRILIAEANGLQPPYTVREGQTLRIPRTRHHTVSAKDTTFSIAMDYGVPWEQIALANNLPSSTTVKPGQKLLIPTLLNPPASSGVTTTPATRPTPVAPATSSARRGARFLWPVNGNIRRGYSTGSNYHDGIDITAPTGTMVRAAAAGTVSFAGHEKDQFGNLVVLDHGNGWYTAYGFLSRITVKQGATVTAGERIGLVGNTGRARGSELHFEVRANGKPVDPLRELPEAR